MNAGHLVVAIIGRGHALSCSSARYTSRAMQGIPHHCAIVSGRNFFGLILTGLRSIATAERNGIVDLSVNYSIIFNKRSQIGDDTFYNLPYHLHHNLVSSNITALYNLTKTYSNLLVLYLYTWQLLGIGF